MKLETTLSHVGRSIDIAITAVQTQTPLLVNTARNGLAGILVKASDKVRPKVTETAPTSIQVQESHVPQVEVQN